MRGISNSKGRDTELSNEASWCSYSRATLCAILCILAVSTSAVAQDANNANLVEKGRQIFSLACVQCHAAAHTTIQRKPASGWRKTVYTMISRGAPVLPGETDTLVAYLTATYGPSSSPAALQNTPAATAPAGSEVVTASCGSCHPAAVVFGAVKSDNEWKATIRQMRTLGASISEAQEKQILDYLTRRPAAK